jgi:hypothetical protein
MRMLIRYFDGRIQHAVFLSAGANLIRVAIPGRHDAVELLHIGGQWFDEEDEPVQIDFCEGSGLEAWPVGLDSFFGELWMETAPMSIN